MTPGQPPVKWEFRASRGSGNEAVIRISANISAGWHLYSQHLADGGPQPTQILFEPSDRFDLIGSPQETGIRTSFYDSLYEMKIIWYSGTADFEQRVFLREPNATATGRIEYMVCNNHVCVPAKQTFAVKLEPR